LTEQLRQAPVTVKGARDYMRVMFAGAHDEIPDRQGRITIPQGLRTYAGLDRDCVVIGANTRVEIWDSTSWTQYLTDREKGFADVSEEVFPGLF
jgi:MraZ protein